MLKTRKLMAAVATCLMCNACTNEQPVMTETVTTYAKLYATVEKPMASRTAIDPADVNAEQIPVLWTPGDALGVYTASSKNIRYESTSRTANAEEGVFATSETLSDSPLYAYYPYSAANATNEVTALTGNVPRTQSMNLLTGSIPGDYKVGTPYETVTDGVKFTFTHLFALVRVQIDATDTDLAGEQLLSVTCSVTRNGVQVPITGNFTFDATTGTYTTGSSTYNDVVFDWSTRPTLSGEYNAFASVFPAIQEDDELTFTILTSGHQATFTVASKIDLPANSVCTFPLVLSDLEGVTVTERSDVSQSGTFTCATYNVDGLPQKLSLITINDDGPGSDGTTAISSKIAEQGWDFVGFSEDFNYHTELTSSLSDLYTFGTHRGTVTGTSNDTDGLGFAVNNNTASFSNESLTAFVNEYGGLTAGANTCIDKGYRYYLVTLKDGTEIDVYITHMNTYSSSGTDHINAQHGQLTEIAEAINDNRNKRPVIFMGDTNCRYTRHDFQTYFWGKLDADLTVNDPWADFLWDGNYPTYPSNSIMVEDATGTSDTDIIYSKQHGEVVDKVIYINDPQASVQITATGYLRDYDNFNGLADHMPIVVKFYYEKKAE